MPWQYPAVFIISRSYSVLASRHSATQALLTRDDVIVVASVSCIYNLGSPADYKNLSLDLFEGQKIRPSEIVSHLVRLQYGQDIELKRGTFRKSTNEIEIVSSTGDKITKIKLSGNKVVKLSVADGVNLDEIFYNDPKFERIIEAKVFPAKYWIATNNKVDLAINNVKAELQKHIKKLSKQGLYLEAERLERLGQNMTLI